MVIHFSYVNSQQKLYLEEQEATGGGGVTMTFANLLLRRRVLQLSFAKLYLGENNDLSGKLFFVSVFPVLKKVLLYGSFISPM